MKENTDPKTITQLEELTSEIRSAITEIEKAKSRILDDQTEHNRLSNRLAERVGLIDPFCEVNLTSYTMDRAKQDLLSAWIVKAPVRISALENQLCTRLRTLCELVRTEVADQFSEAQIWACSWSAFLYSGTSVESARKALRDVDTLLATKTPPLSEQEIYRRTHIVNH